MSADTRLAFFERRERDFAADLARELRLCAESMCSAAERLEAGPSKITDVRADMRDVEVALRKHDIAIAQIEAVKS